MRPAELRLAAVAVAIGFVASGSLVWIITSQATRINCNPGGWEQTPLGGAALAIGRPTEQTIGPAHWYNATVESAGGGLRVYNVGFQFQSAGTLAVSPGAKWNLTALDLGGAVIGAYALTGPAAGSWTVGGSSALVSQDAFSLLTNPENLSGGMWTFDGVGSYPDGCPVQWSITVGVP